MKKLLKNIVIAAAMVIGATSLTACNKVTPGNVGVYVKTTGSDTDKDSIQRVGLGWKFTAWGHDLYLFPTTTQNKEWSGEQAFKIQPSEGGDEWTVNVGLAYHVDPNKAVDLFQKYRQGIDEITDNYLHNMIRDAFIRHASKLSVEELYGSGKTQLLIDVKADVANQVAPYGIIIENIYFTSSPLPPKAVVESMNQKISEQQHTERQKQAALTAVQTADARKNAAQGEKDAAILKAQGEAEAIRIQGEALRQNPTVIQLRLVEKWSGNLPLVQGQQQGQIIDMSALIKAQQNQ
ncbi:putative transposase [Erwinia phage SunLIRen]|uniref:Putative transposase n=1 Tax=Erwinia phage SunLIRen TaxID=2267654 RepID=A0A346FHX4_9CAUD|nr:putative transposase [Erwinia phage SunLIRen]